MDPLSRIKCSEFVYQDSALPRELLNSFNLFREEDTLTDVEVKVEYESFRCHKMILAAASPYYKALFKHDPAAQENSILSFPNTRAPVFREILDFMYTSKLTITEENVFDLLELADFLQFRDVVDCCCEIIHQHIRADNAVSILQLSEAHLCQALAHAASTFIKANFPTVIETPDFVKLPIDRLQDFLSDKTTLISCEEKLFKALCVWMDADIHERKCYMETLFECVHCKTLDKLQRTELETLFPFVKMHLEELEVAQSIEQIIQHGGDGAQYMQTERPRKKIVLIPENISRHGATEKVVLMYDEIDGKWSELSQIPQDGTVSLQRTAVVDNCIYITGGEINGIISNRVLKYDVLADAWSKCAPMNRPRFNHAVTEAMGYLYAFGGDVDTFRAQDDAFEFGTVNTLERYDPKADQWDMLEPLDSRHGFHSHFTLSNFDLVHLGNFLYVIGGTKTTRTLARRRHTTLTTPAATPETTTSRHATVKTYAIDANRWSSDDYLPTQLAFQSLKLHSGTCFAWSGLLLFIDEDMRGKRSMLYNPVTHTLADFLPTHGQHRFGGYLVDGERVVAVGGMAMIRGVLQAHDLVHRATLSHAGHWHMLDPLPFPLSHFKAVRVLK